MMLLITRLSLLIEALLRLMLRTGQKISTHLSLNSIEVTVRIAMCMMDSMVLIILPR